MAFYFVANGARGATTLALACCLVFHSATDAAARQNGLSEQPTRGYLETASASFDFDCAALDKLGWALATRGGVGEGDRIDDATFAIVGAVPAGEPALSRAGTETGETSTVFVTRGGLILTGQRERQSIGNLLIKLSGDGAGSVWSALDASSPPFRVFDLHSLHYEFDASTDVQVVTADVSVCPTWAHAINAPQSADVMVGTVRVLVDLRDIPQFANVEAVFAEWSVPLVRAAESAGPVGTPDSQEASGGVSGMTGPDVIVAELDSVFSFGQSGNIFAFAVGTISCNIGNERASWISWNNQHPVIAQSMYRLKDDRFEQIGMSWVKHGFFAVNDCLCGGCVNAPSCDDPTNGTELGVGCSDPYSAGLNGDQGNMSLPSEINPFTGDFVYPWTAPAPEPVIGRRLQVHADDLDPGLNAGATYFVQAHYVTADDAAAGNARNNASYREVLPIPSGEGYAVVTRDETQREQPASRAWQDMDNSVLETDLAVPGEGLFIMASHAVDLENGFWRYDYAVQNLNSERSARTFRVPLPTGGTVQGFGFHDVDHHSGEPYSGTDWSFVVDEESITWSTSTYDEDAMANALRWNTLYSFWFESSIGPGTGMATLGLFKSGFPPALTGEVVVPAQDFVDCNNNEIHDGCDLDCAAIGCGLPCGDSLDCNANTVPDECEVDCNGNGIPDDCDLTTGASPDCNGNTVPDECEVPPLGSPESDCNANGTPDDCETIGDADEDGIIDCYDLCPETTPPNNSCLCPPFGECCWPHLGGLCLPDLPPEVCLQNGGVPECAESPCRQGCLIGDGDGDGDHDLIDFGLLQNCYSGPVGSPGFVTPSADCLFWFDERLDGDVDQEDHRFLYLEFSGP